MKSQFQFAVHVPGRAWGSARSNKSTSETRRSLRSEIPDGSSSTRGQEPSTSVGGSFCFAGALRDGVVYSSWFNKQKFIYKGEY